MIVASNTQAVGAKVGLVAGTIGGKIGASALETATQQIDKDLQTGLAKAGANIANQTMNEWLKLHWWKILIAVVALGIGLKFLIGGGKQRR